MLLWLYLCLLSLLLAAVLGEPQEWVSLDPVPTDWPIIAEAENFTLSGGWSVTEWGQDHYYGATFSNTFA